MLLRRYRHCPRASAGAWPIWGALAHESVHAPRSDGLARPAVRHPARSAGQPSSHAGLRLILDRTGRHDLENPSYPVSNSCQIKGTSIGFRLSWTAVMWSAYCPPPGSAITTTQIRHATTAMPAAPKDTRHPGRRSACRGASRLGCRDGGMLDPYRGQLMLVRTFTSGVTVATRTPL